MAISVAPRSPTAASPGNAAIWSRSCAASSTEGPGPDGAPTPQRRRIWGRQSPLRAGRRLLLAEALPSYRFELGRGPVEPATLFDRPVRAVWLEIGFGGGEHLAAQAAANPDVGLIGVEPFLAGVAKLVAACTAGRLDNVRVLVDDARLLLEALPTASIERAFVLFPDPWPKTRHQKRRIVSRETVTALARVLVPGGELRLATDDPGYVTWMLDAVAACPLLEWPVRRAADWRERRDGWTATRYEAKARAAGRPCFFLRLYRVAEAAAG